MIYVSPLVSRPEDIEVPSSVPRASFDSTHRSPRASSESTARRGRCAADGTGRPVPRSRTRSRPPAPSPAPRTRGVAAPPAAAVPVLEGVDVERAQRSCRESLARQPAGGWLDATSASRLLASFGVHVVTTGARHCRRRRSAADDLGYPVGLKAAAPGLVHKTDVGGVRLGLDSGDAVREAFVTMHAALGDRMGGALVQPMAEPGVELIVGVTHDTLFGPLVLFGMGGIDAELMRDTSLRIVPVTVFDATRCSARSAARRGSSATAAPPMSTWRRSKTSSCASVNSRKRFRSLRSWTAIPLVASATGAIVLDVKLRLEPRRRALPIPRRPLSR